MIKEFLKFKTQKMIFKILKKTLPIWLPAFLIIFFVMMTANIISDFFKIDESKEINKPISKEAVLTYKEYEKNSIIQDEIGIEKVYMRDVDTEHMVNDFMTITQGKLDRKNEMIIKKSDATYPYRCFYELLSALEIVSSKENIQKIDNNEDFITDFVFSDNDIKHYVSEFVVKETFINGKKTKDARYQVDYVYVRPAGQLKSVSTIFHDITFEYEKKIINEKDWTRSRSSKTSTKVNNGEKIKKKVVTTTYTRSQDEAYVLKETYKYKNYRLETLIENALKNKMITTDLLYVYEYGRAFENSTDFDETMLEYLSPETGYKFSDIYLEASNMIDYVGGDLIWPSNEYKRITSPFGDRIHPVSGSKKFHSGIDIAIPYGKPILAAQMGEVVFSGKMGGYGFVIVIDHGGGIHTLYAHNSKLIAKVGDSVNKGQKIAECGSTGISTGAHLHFEVRNNGEYKNPLEYIKKEYR